MSSVNEDSNEPKNTEAEEHTTFSTIAASRSSWDPRGPSKKLEDKFASCSCHTDAALCKPWTLKLALAASRPSVSSASWEGRGAEEKGQEEENNRSR